MVVVAVHRLPLGQGLGVQPCEQQRGRGVRGTAGWLAWEGQGGPTGGLDLRVELGQAE